MESPRFAALFLCLFFLTLVNTIALAGKPAVPVTGQVRLGVYDVKGRLVKELVREEMSAGEHTVIWHGKTDGGVEAGTGVYFVRLETGGRTESRKILFLK